MAAQTSLTRINSYSKVLTKNCKLQFLLVLVLCVLSGFMNVIGMIAFGKLENGFITEGVFFSFLVALAGILIVPALFRELYNRQYADVEFSLPMSAAERYKAKLFVLAKLHILPFIISQAITVLVALTFARSDTPTVLLTFLSNLSALAFTDGIALLCMSCCGSIVESLYSSLFMAISVSTIIPAAYLKLFMGLSGRHSNAFDPFALPIGFPELAVKLLGYDDEWYGDRSVPMLLISLALSAMLFYIAYLIYRRRSGLSTGKPIVYKAFYCVLILLSTLTVVLLCFLNSFYLAIFIGLLVCVGICVTSNRGKLTLRKLMFSMLALVGCLACVLVAGFAGYATNGFGYVRNDLSEKFKEHSNDKTALLMIDYYPGDELYQAGIYDYHEEFPIVEDSDYEKASKAFILVADEIDRSNKSFGDNLKNYLDTVIYENKDVKEYAGATFSIRCDVYHRFIPGEAPNDYYDNILFSCTPEQAMRIKQKLKDAGINTISYREYFEQNDLEFREKDMPGRSY